MKIEKAYHKNSDVLKWKRITDSDGTYRIKGKEVTKEEFDSFVNDDIIEVNGIKYKRI
jgi:hypothetical protein